MQELLRARNLVKVYPGGVRAVDGIDFDVRPGQCFGLLGPNGAGKTTTLEMLEGISRPTSGEILYRGCLPNRDFRPIHESEQATAKVERHQIDLLLDLRGSPRYLINEHSARGYLAERLLLAAYGQSDTLPRRITVTGRNLRYVDWVLPGILAMNVMFSSLWGVGWVIVRYRKNGVLRRLHATPLSAFEFLSAQILSRLVVVLGASIIVYVGANLFLDFVMRGSYLALFLVYLAGSLCLISLGLIVAARLRTEELADGVLNLLSWPMLLLSGVWFSMEGTNPAAQALSQLLPLTHLVNAARRVMVDGAGVAGVLSEIMLLLGVALVLLLIAAQLFRWE